MRRVALAASKFTWKNDGSYQGLCFRSATHRNTRRMGVSAREFRIIVMLEDVVCFTAKTGATVEHFSPMVQQYALGLIDLRSQEGGAAAVRMDFLHESSVRFYDLFLGGPFV